MLVSKVPCGGFNLDNNFLSMNKNGELSLVDGSSEGNEFKQLVTDREGNTKWEERLAYEDIIETDITGMEINARLGHLFETELPLELGQKWKIVKSTGDRIDGLYDLDTGVPNVYEVNEYNGQLYFGASPEYINSSGNVENAPNGDVVCVTKTRTYYHFKWSNMVHVFDVKFVCVSGSTTKKILKTIDSKYIPPTTVIVNLTSNDDGSFSADKTFDEVKALIDSGIDVKCKYGTVEANYVSYNEDEGMMFFERFSFVMGFDYFFGFAPEVIIGEIVPSEYFLLPNISTSDNNKFLRVVDGAWKASSDLIIPSSTSGSKKNFKITVDDSGTITATEV